MLNHGIKSIAKLWTLVLCLVFAVVLLTQPLAAMSDNDYRNMSVYAGGMPFGIKFVSDGVAVVGFTDMDNCENPAKAAGFQINDVIKTVNGKKIDDAKTLTQEVETCNGKEIRFSVLRGNDILNISLIPVKSDDGWVAGLWVRDGGSGIGTVTFIDTDDNSFAGLGHGICSSDTGELIKITQGSVCNVKITGIQKGQDGTPGELKGYFSSDKTGVLVSNTECGVFGTFSKLPDGVSNQKYKLAEISEITEGDAEILTAPDGGEVKAYSARISAINPKETGSKCFMIRVTDPELIELTGGIVQGMSGSPIVQNGKIVGAVTHVLINDSTVGYGIFAKNMFDNMPK